MHDVFSKDEHRLFRAVREKIVPRERLLEKQIERWEQWKKWDEENRG